MILGQPGYMLRYLQSQMMGHLEDLSTFSFRNTNITNTIVGAGFLIGALLVSFSKEKNEDEFIAEIRLSSLLWAVCVSYTLLLVAFLFVYGSPFFEGHDLQYVYCAHHIHCEV